MPSGEEIQRALREFVGRWSDYTGSEKSEAQTFLNELFTCYGTDRRDIGAEFEYFAGGVGFMDLHWPEVCLIEMKRSIVPVVTARDQVDRYWRATSDQATGRQSARFIVICNFQALEIWDYRKFPDAPVASFDLVDLPDRYDALAFLAGPSIEPNFAEHYRELTKDAAQTVADVFKSLVERSAAPPTEIQAFVLQSVWCMFAEDLGLLDGYPLQATLNEVRSHPERSAAEIGFLFRVLNQKGNHNRSGRLAGTQYVNGDLFAVPAEVGLNRDEVELMLKATAFDWRRVNPTIFGSLLEGVLGKERRWQIGAHYTHEVDIMKIVGPTIVRPWRERIDATATPTEARGLLDELCTFKVLDPACGCGNFLYVAYRELRALEWELKQRIVQLAGETGLAAPAEPEPFYPVNNLQGIDVERSAVEIAKVTLWMGQRQMIDRYGEAEAPLPLQSLPGIRQADALRTDWPETDCIVGNPPFLGAKFIRPSQGDSYADWLIQEFDIGVKDLCVYWFRRAHTHLKPGQRAGLVGTNSVSQTGGRTASLEYIVRQGGTITDAISSQKWPGDAKVHVSIVNWVKGQSTSFVLNGEPVTAISTRLTSGDDDSENPATLDQNVGRCFAGVVPQAKGFLVSPSEENALLCDTDKDYAAVVRRFLTGDDLAKRPDQAPSRSVIDFASMPLEEASQYPAALRLVRERVRPERESSPNRAVETRWWLYGRRVPAMRQAIASLPRFVAAPATGKRWLTTWQENTTLPNNAVVVFAFHDDYSMGVLTSRAHSAWAWARSSTLKGDLRYTSAAAFMTFPWPDPVSLGQRERVAGASRQLLTRRSQICMAEQIGLTKLYNAVDEGAWVDLRALHRELDEAVVDCYGWPSPIAQDDRELVRRLTDLNREISERGRAYAPFD